MKNSKYVVFFILFLGNISSMLHGAKAYTLLIHNATQKYNIRAKSGDQQGKYKPGDRFGLVSINSPTTRILVQAYKVQDGSYAGGAELEIVNPNFKTMTVVVTKGVLWGFNYTPFISEGMPVPKDITIKEIRSIKVPEF